LPSTNHSGPELLLNLSHGLIGANGKIPWHYKGDLQRFKRVTMGATIVMGRKTYASINRPLPGRKNVVLSASLDQAPEGTFLARSFDEVVERWHTNGGGVPLWVCGGSAVYEAALPHAQVLDVTFVPQPGLDFPPEKVLGVEDLVFFPKVDPAEWKLVARFTIESEPLLRGAKFVRNGQ
jgi:dihydrofolate reductase